LLTPSLPLLPDYAIFCRRLMLLPPPPRHFRRRHIRQASDDAATPRRHAGHMPLLEASAPPPIYARDAGYAIYASQPRFDAAMSRPPPPPLRQMRGVQAGRQASACGARHVARRSRLRR